MQSFGRRSFVVAVSVFALVALATAPAGAVTVWREGEDATIDRMNRHPGWYDKVKKEQLSGGEWISNFAEGKEGVAGYDIRIPEAARYTFWVRANPVKSRLSYRLDGGNWKEIDFENAEQVENIAADDAPDLRFIGWVKVGTLPLPKGDHTIRFKTHSENQCHGAIDAFVLTTEPFTPQGKAKPADVAGPGEPTAPQPLLNEQNSWAFRPLEAEAGREGLLDLRHLNEEVAGQKGFIRLSEDGMGFVRGDGEPIRFWSVVSGIAGMEPEEMDRHCRFLARRGVNMLRLHANIAVRKDGARITDVNRKGIDGIWRAVATARKYGIYVTVSPYWYHHKIPASWGLEGYEGGEMPTGTMFFNEKFQDAYKTWVRELYTPENPYTGVPLKDEPAVAIIQVKNEDSLLFYTFDRIPAEQKRILGRMFGDWLKEKYGSLEAALRAWDGETVEGDGKEMIGDDFRNGVVGFYITWFLTQPASGGRAVRISDQLQFIAETQRAFYEEIDRYYREELGCKQLTNAMNWKSADKLTTDDAERWTYTACDVIAVNRYTGGQHVGPNNGYRIDPGHYLVNRSILRDPLQMPTNLKQVVGHPFVITESAWVHPNLYQTEGPIMAAAYMGLTGVDSLYWFALGEPTWLRDPRRKFWHVKPGETGYALNKWSGSVPQQAGMFPANALIHRLGYVERGETVVHEERTLSHLWQRKPPVIAETETFDPIRDVEDLRGQTGAEVGEISRFAFLVGPVEATFQGDPAETRAADLSPYVDGAAQVVRSNTGQIELDYRVGLLRLDTPKAQGVAGFLKQAGGTFVLDDVTIESGNEYATIELVSMDGEPLSESGKVLVQVGTLVRLTGWVTRDDTFESGDELVEGKRIVQTGKPPWRIMNTEATVTIANPNLSKATLVDEAGYAAGEVSVEKTDGGLSVQLPTDAMYVLLQ